MMSSGHGSNDVEANVADNRGRWFGRCFSDILSSWVILALGATYLLISAAMITFNKYLMQKGHFPYASTLVMIHMGFSSMLTFGMYLISPSMFPSLASFASSADVKQTLKCAIPIAIFFSLNLVLSNTAYLYCTVAFLQMMKEGNVVLVYLFSLMASLEIFSWTKAALLFMVVCAATFTVHGELQFSYIGFFVQGTAQVFETMKIVLQAVLLTSVGRKLDAFSYTLVVAPLCFAFLGGILFCLVYVHPMSSFLTPTWAEVVTWSPVLLANASIAFALNVTMAIFIKNSSAVSFILCGIVKDAMIVTCGVAFMGEHITGAQTFGFCFQIYLIWLWSMMKQFPKMFEQGMVTGMTQLLYPANSEAEQPFSERKFPLPPRSLPAQSRHTLLAQSSSNMQKNGQPAKYGTIEE